MKNLYHSLLLVIAGSTQKELASQIRYLKIENEVLRSKLPKRVSVTEKERNKLVKFGSKLDKALNEPVTIVHPETVRASTRSTRNLRPDRSPTSRRNLQAPCPLASPFPPGTIRSVHQKTKFVSLILPLSFH